MNVLIVAAHTDDEALGCGGTIAKHVANGDIVSAIYMADGVSSRNEVGENEFSVRMAATENAQRVLGITDSHYLGFADNKMDSLPLLDIVQPLEAIVEKIEPDIIYTHHLGDLNIDHRITHQAVLTACRPLPSSRLRAIYAFEVLSSTEWTMGGTANAFHPQKFVDITNFLEVKKQALFCYAEEMRPFPHARSHEMVESLAKLRGGTVGMMAAEAFVVIRDCAF